MYILDIDEYHTHLNLGLVKMLQNFHVSFVEVEKVTFKVLRYPSADFLPTLANREISLHGNRFALCAYFLVLSFLILIFPNLTQKSSK